MTVRIKASKDMKRLTEERNAAMQEYSLIMSERDAVHKEIEKLQEEVRETKKRMTRAELKTREWEEERRKLLLQIETLKREIEQALYDRDQAIREAQELRDKLGCGGKAPSRDHARTGARGRGDAAAFGGLYRKGVRDSSSETLESALAAAADRRTKGKINAGGCVPGERLEDVDVANVEIDRLRKVTEELGGELHEAGLEADVAKCRRDLAFSERDKAVLERESIRTLCDKLRRERDRAVSDLAEALRDCDDAKKQMNGTLKENKEFRERLETLEKEIRIKSLQRSPNSHSHSQDSAIDSDLHEWETEVSMYCTYVFLQRIFLLASGKECKLFLEVKNELLLSNFSFHFRTSTSTSPASDRQKTLASTWAVAAMTPDLLVSPAATRSQSTWPPSPKVVSWRPAGGSRSTTAFCASTTSTVATSRGDRSSRPSGTRVSRW